MLLYRTLNCILACGKHAHHCGADNFKGVENRIVWNQTYKSPSKLKKENCWLLLPIILKYDWLPVQWEADFFGLFCFFLLYVAYFYFFHKGNLLLMTLRIKYRSFIITFMVSLCCGGIIHLLNRIFRHRNVKNCEIF